MSKQIGAGTTVVGSITGPIGQIIDTISGPKGEIDDIPTTDMATPDNAKTYIPGLIDNGTVDITVIYDGSNNGIAKSLDTTFNSRTPEVWTITYPDTSTRSFTGYIKTLGQEAPLDDKITQALSLKVSGKVTFVNVAA